MGMYDHVVDETICPKCGKKTKILDQIKWLPYEERNLKYYMIGDNINVPDGCYDYGSGVRTTLDTRCSNCNYRIYFKVIVKDGKINEFVYYDKQDKHNT